MKIGIYGGTFDPVHLGHLILAESVREQLQLDEIWFTPAYLNPHKVDQRPTPPKARMEMLRFAISGNQAFHLNEIEIRRKGPSYTYMTLQAIHDERPGDELFLLIGADTLADFPNWREPERIQKLATLVAVNRGGESAVTPTGIDASRVRVLDMPAIEISATDIRQRCCEGKSIRYLTPRSVELYIQAQSLYSSNES